MYRSYRRIRDDEEDGEKFDYRPGDRTLIETADGLNVRFKLRVLADLLKCPVCCGFFRDAYTIRECLHTFCRICIFNNLEKGNYSCPKCSEPIPTNVHDAIGFDRSIQNLVDKLFHQFSEKEVKEREELYTFCGINISQAPTGSSGLSKNIKKKNEQNWGGWDATAEFFEYVSKGEFPLEINFNLSFALFPVEDSSNRLQRPYFRCSSKMPVLNIIQYLTKKLNIKYPYQIEILLEGLVIPKSHTLEFICRSRKLDPLRCILLQYRIVNYFGGTDNINNDNTEKNISDKNITDKNISDKNNTDKNITDKNINENPLGIE